MVGFIINHYSPTGEYHCCILANIGWYKCVLCDICYYGCVIVHHREWYLESLEVRFDCVIVVHRYCGLIRIHIRYLIYVACPVHEVVTHIRNRFKVYYLACIAGISPFSRFCYGSTITTRYRQIVFYYRSNLHHQALHRFLIRFIIDRVVAYCGAALTQDRHIERITERCVLVNRQVARTCRRDRHLRTIYLCSYRRRCR